MLLLPLDECHPLDPRLIDWGEDHAHYIYGDDYGNVAARVDAEDYQYFSQWRWAPKPDKHGRKIYLFRTLTERSGAGYKRTSSLYLHVEILLRKQPERPSPKHTIADHGDGDTLECRRFNLAWVTPRENCLNRRTESYRIGGKFAKR